LYNSIYSSTKLRQIGEAKEGKCGTLNPLSNSPQCNIINYFCNLKLELSKLRAGVLIFQFCALKSTFYRNIFNVIALV
jgi:hypothetical protein